MITDPVRQTDVKVLMHLEKRSVEATHTHTHPEGWDGSGDAVTNS